MGVFRTVGRGFRWTAKSFFDVPSWVAWPTVKGFANSMFTNVTKMFIPTKSTVKETYEQALTRFGMTDEQAQEKAADLHRLSMFFVVLAMFIVIYSVIVAWEGLLVGFMLGIVVSFISLCTAYRYHFWSFQIRKRQFGCSFRDWLKGLD